jgi:hypothetical protein
MGSCNYAQTAYINFGDFMSSRITTKWVGVPHTCPTAKNIESREATGIYAVQINNGSFRKASISGVFELADPDTNVRVNKNGKVKIEVKMGWFGVKPPTSWANVTIIGQHTLLNDYSGPVVHNLSGRRRSG